MKKAIFINVIFVLSVLAAIAGFFGFLFWLFGGEAGTARLAEMGFFSSEISFLVSNGFLKSVKNGDSHHFCIVSIAK